jgi:Lrp/AsnC family transcriptional regulator for asnA, asnC and gidA
MTKKANNLDSTDYKIINLLQIDGRMPNTAIARKLGISESTVRSRLTRLIEEDFVQIVAVSNPFKIGYQTIGILKLRVDIKKMDEVIVELERIKSVWFIVHTTGESDIYAEFVAESIEALNELLFSQIYKIDGILHAETSLILKYIKRNYNWLVKA